MSLLARSLALVGAVTLLLAAGTILSVARAIFLESEHWTPAAGGGLDGTVVLVGTVGALLAIIGGLSLFGVAFGSAGPRYSLGLLVIPGISGGVLSLIGALLMLLLHPNGGRVALLISPLLLGASALVVLSGMLMRNRAGRSAHEPPQDLATG